MTDVDKVENILGLSRISSPGEKSSQIDLHELVDTYVNKNYLL